SAAAAAALAGRYCGLSCPADEPCMGIRAGLRTEAPLRSGTGGWRSWLAGGRPLPWLHGPVLPDPSMPVVGTEKSSWQHYLGC
ncbi:unnamed protein product, partial [Symbiodinium natans]